VSRGFPAFDTSLALAKRIHGNACARLAVGTRLAIAGLKAIGIKDPKGKDQGSIMVFVEIDRCVSDAVMAVTGCRPGKRTMRIVDYGKVAATFFNLRTGRAVRVSIKDRSHDEPVAISPEASRLKPFMGLSDMQLFDMREVSVVLPPEDMPGRLLGVAVCERCGEIIMDMRDVHRAGRKLCKPCAEGTSYYTEKQDAQANAGIAEGRGRHRQA